MDKDDEILASDLRDYGVEIADRCQWPGCNETRNLKLGATADEFFVLCARHVEAVMGGVELGEGTPTRGCA